MALNSQPCIGPIVIRIERVNGEWTIRPSTIDPFDSGNPGGPKQSDVMDLRRQRIESRVLTAWGDRRAGRSPRLPHFKTEAGHIPVVVQAGESVRFECEGGRVFSISVLRDPDVTITTGSAPSPFVDSMGRSLTVPQTYTGSSPNYTVAANIVGQRFYKCTAWIDLGEGEVEIVDPDVLGDDGL